MIGSKYALKLALRTAVQYLHVSIKKNHCATGSGYPLICTLCKQLLGCDQLRRARHVCRKARHTKFLYSHICSQSHETFNQEIKTMPRTCPCGAGVWVY